MRYARARNRGASLAPAASCVPTTLARCASRICASTHKHTAHTQHTHTRASARATCNTEATLAQEWALPARTIALCARPHDTHFSAAHSLSPRALRGVDADANGIELGGRGAARSMCPVNSCSMGTCHTPRWSPPRKQRSAITYLCIGCQQREGAVLSFSMSMDAFFHARLLGGLAQRGPRRDVVGRLILLASADSNNCVPLLPSTEKSRVAHR